VFCLTDECVAIDASKQKQRVCWRATFATRQSSCARVVVPRNKTDLRYGDCG
jgi:hypothetical protein